MLPRIYKSHIQGILFRLGILKSHGKQIRIQSKKIEECNLEFNDSPFQIVSSKRCNPSYKTVELAVKPTELDNDNFKLFTKDDMIQIREIFFATVFSAIQSRQKLFQNYK